MCAGGRGTQRVQERNARHHQVLIACAMAKPGEAEVDLSQFAPVEGPPGAGNRRSRLAEAAAPPLSVNGVADLPDGTGKSEFVTMCSNCHGISTALSSRRSPDGWPDLIQEMRSRGAPGDAATTDRVHD